MSRYTDADALAYMVTCNGDVDFINKVTKLMVEAPSIDIVRCKECKYWNTDGCREGVGECTWAYYMTKPDDFCSYGEREGE